MSTLDKVLAALELYRLGISRYTMASLDAPAGDDPDGATIGEAVTDSRPSPETLAVRARYCHRLVAILPVRERSVIELRFGLCWPHREWQLDQIGMLAALSKERIRQIERSALRRLRGELPARQVPELAQSWTAPVDTEDRLAAIEDVLMRDDLDPADRRRFQMERGRLKNVLRQAAS